jgi:5-methylcytosine-specific restriction endonuclease McrA
MPIVPPNLECRWQIVINVRFTPESGHSPTRSGCPLWAINGLMHRSKKTRYSINSSARRQFWNAPSGEARLLRRLQARRCGQTGGRLWRDAEVDHRIPLFRVWRDHRNEGWPKLLSRWGLPNVQVINRDFHITKWCD